MDISKVNFYRPACVLRADGPDAREFLQGQFSNDLQKAEAGNSVYGLWLNRKGKIVADSFALCRSDESFFLVSVHCSEATIFERLDEYLVMDDVELAGASSSSFGMCVWGEAIEVVLSEFELERPAVDCWTENAGVFAFWGNRSSEKSIELIFHGEAALANFERAKALSRESAFAELDEGDLSQLAVRDCRPRVGVEIGDDDLPQEVGLVESAVSFKKGCYLGQEVMARIHAMGKVRKELVAIELDEFVEPEKLPLQIFDESGKKKGAVRAVQKVEDRHLGLAIVSTGAVAGLCIEFGDTRFSVRLLS